MPQAAISAVSAWFISVGVNAALAKFVATVFVYAASTYLLNRASKALAPKQRGAPGLKSGFEVNYFDTGAPIRIVYGQVRTGGLETIPPIVSGADNTFLHKVLTLAGHEVDSYNCTIFDTTTVTNAQIAPNSYQLNQALSTSYSDGRITAGVYSGHGFIRHYKGTSTESTDALLMRGVAAPAFSNFIARGIAKVALTFKFNHDIYKSVPNVTFIYQGKRCYDPRLDSSPGANPTNASYIAWTRNPALCLCDYLMAVFGGEYASTDIDWDTVVTAANYCDALVNIPGATTQARYTCNGVLLATDQFEDNIKLLVDTMLGRLIFRDGKWRVYAGSWQTPSFTIQLEDWVNGGTSTRFEQGKRKRFNKMQCWYTDKDRDWQRVQCIPQSNATYVTADKGETISAETEQPLCDSEYEAQRKTRFLLRQSRNQVIISGKLPPRFQNISLWETGTIADAEWGWSSKTFRAVSLDINPDGSVDGVFAEEQSGDWDDLLAAEYNQPATDALPANNVMTPSAPVGFALSPQINGTIIFSWTRPVVFPPGAEIQIIRNTSDNAATGTVVWQGTANPTALVMPVSRHYYWGRTVAPSSAFSAFSPNSNGLSSVARLESDNTQQQRLVGDAEFTFTEAASLWQVGAFQTNGLAAFTNNGAGTALAAAPVTIDLVNSTGIAAYSYSPTGGQYGGTMQLTRSSTNSTLYTPILLAAGVTNSRGTAYSGEAFGVEYVARIRSNSFAPFWSSQVQFATVVHFSTPSSPDMRLLTGRFVVGSSSSLRLGEYAFIRGAGVVVPIVMPIFPGSGTPAAVQSASGFFMRPVIVAGETSANSGSGNITIDYFQATDVGHRNEPLSATEMDATPCVLHEFMSMVNAIVSNNQAITFPSSATYRWSDWRQYPIGRRFSLTKNSTTLAAYITPSSGMNLRLAGRAAVGTVTMVSSLPGYAVVEKTSATDFVVNGQGVI